MNWIKYYNDLTTKEKRQLRQIILNDGSCQISKGAFYNYLKGKQPRKIVSDRINMLVDAFRLPSTPFVAFE